MTMIVAAFSVSGQQLFLYLVLLSGVCALQIQNHSISRFTEIENWKGALHSVVASLSANANTNKNSHRKLQIGFGDFSSGFCQPVRDTLTLDFGANSFSCNCLSTKGGPPFTLRCTINQVCIPGGVTNIVGDKTPTCPGQICVSPYFEVVYNEFLDLISSENTYVLSGSTAYQRVGTRTVATNPRSTNFVKLNNKEYHCQKGEQACGQTQTNTFDCTNIQRGLVRNTCPGGDTTVLLWDKGVTKMKDIRLGDRVQVAGGHYEPIYSFGHRNMESFAEYLAISFDDGSPLEISRNHMVGLANGSFVPASMLRLGDALIHSSGNHTVVQSIQTVQRHGAYAPFTESGTIVVNGILASTYVAYSESEYLKIFNVEMPFTYQWLAHAFQFVHRLAFRLNLVGEETYSATGVSHWVEFPHKVVTWLFQQQSHHVSYW